MKFDFSISEKSKSSYELFSGGAFPAIPNPISDNYGTIASFTKFFITAALLIVLLKLHMINQNIPIM